MLDHRRDSARKAHALAAARGIATLDAPVSGGVGGAKAATLTFMVGGSEHAFARGKPVLEHMGKRIVHCGEAGNGQVAKICNNMILGASMIAVSEAFVLGEKLGLSHQAMFDVVSASSGQCWSLTSYCPVPGPVPASPANNGYKAGFTAALMLKDLKLAKAAANSVKAETRDRRPRRANLRATDARRTQRRRFFDDHQSRAQAIAWLRFAIIRCKSGANADSGNREASHFEPAVSGHHRHKSRLDRPAALSCDWRARKRADDNTGNAKQPNPAGDIVERVAT